MNMSLKFYGTYYVPALCYWLMIDCQFDMAGQTEDWILNMNSSEQYL